MELKSQEMRKLAPELDPLRIGTGWAPEDLEKPQIIIESTFGDSHPGSGHLDTLVEEVRKGVEQAGGHGARYFCTDICDVEKNGYKYLETVKRAKTDAMNTYLWPDIDYEVISDSVKYDFLYKSYEKNRKIYSCLNRWMYLRENGIHLSAYLCSLGVSTVAIYGMGILGKHLLNEFEDGLIEIKYLIDKNTRLQFKDYNLVAPDGELEETDAIIVTAVSDLDFIFRKLDGKTNAKLIGIEEIIYES